MFVYYPPKQTANAKTKAKLMIELPPSPPTQSTQSNGGKGRRRSPSQQRSRALTASSRLPLSTPLPPPLPLSLSLPLPLPVQPPPYQLEIRPALAPTPQWHHPAYDGIAIKHLATRPFSVAFTEAASTTFEPEPEPGEQESSPWNTDPVDADVYHRVSSKLDTLITCIDGEAFDGNDDALVLHEVPEPALRGGWAFPRKVGLRTAANNPTPPKNYFAKVNRYANSRLPFNLPPLKLYLPAYPLVCLAAQFSLRVYDRPSGKEREAHVDSDWRKGTKAMVFKSVPVDHMKTMVFAIRGSQTFMDWAVNLKSSPASPAGFLDDSGNMCHVGFLSVARKMIRPVAARLRSLLEEDPSRRGCSLIMTGHSAGGAVASLLFAHMFSEQIKSELTLLTGCFKRIHCITFGAPPVSLLPLAKPVSERWRKSLFLSFINEGDPVPRSDKAYVRSLLSLYTSAVPGAMSLAPLPDAPKGILKTSLLRPKARRSQSAPSTPAPIWALPTATLSNAGRLVVMRPAFGGATTDDVGAVVANDQQLRCVVYGDPMMHMMKEYARRVELLATKAVTAKG